MNNSFAEIAKKRFGDLVKLHHMKCTMSSSETVHWENRHVLLQLKYDSRRSFELSLEINQLPPNNTCCRDPYTLDDILRIPNQKSADLRSFQASTDERLSYVLKVMADLLRQHGQKLLEGDQAAFKALEENRLEYRSMYIKEFNLKTMRQDAEVAWNKKDYRLLTDIYQRNLNDLNPIELKRYKIALKRGRLG